MSAQRADTSGPFEGAITADTSSVKAGALGKGIEPTGRAREGVDAIKREIQQSGTVKPIEITKDGFIVDGEHTYRALLELGVEDIPVHVGEQAGSSGRLVKPYSGMRLDVKLPKSSPSIPKELEPLAAEARKYKSAEEFRKAQGAPLIHRTNKTFTEFDLTKRRSSAVGFHFFNDSQKAADPKYVARFGKNVIKVYPQGRIADLTTDQTFKEIGGGRMGTTLADYLKTKGYIGLKMGEETIIFNPKNFMTEQQLTDFYTKVRANK